MNQNHFEYVKLETKVETEEALQTSPEYGDVPTCDFQLDCDEIKCGIIFITENGKKYSFVCEFCKVSLLDLESFGSHLQMKHLIRDPCEETTDTSVEFEIKNEAEKSKWDEVEKHISLDNSDVSCYSPKAKEQQSEETDMNDSDSSVTFDEVGLYCKKCKRNFKNKRSFDLHKNRHKIRALRPKRLNRSHKRQPKLLGGTSEPEDASNNFNDIKMLCKLCNLSYKFRASYNYHKILHANGLIKPMPKVNKCNLTISKPAKDPNLHCDICSKYFKKSKEFRDHSDQIHGDAIPRVLQADPSYRKCKFCSQSFEKVTERLSHESSHTEVKPYQCLLCPRTFEKGHFLEWHMQAHDGPYINGTKRTIRKDSSSKTYACQYCGKVFNQSRSLVSHERVHTKEKPYQCEECGQSFRISSQLSSHRKRHANIREYSCVCGKMFFTGKALKDHQAMHTGERPFACPHCHKTFPRKKALNAHVQIHAEIKRYECKICGKRFSQCASLITHRKIHDGELPI